MIALFPELVTVSQQCDTERLALLVRKYYCGDKPFLPKIDLAHICANVGIELEVRPLSDDAILCVKDEKGEMRVVAFINENIPAGANYEFLLAHLLGHFFLHVQPKLANADWRTSGMREIWSPALRFSGQMNKIEPSKVDRLEMEADDFAGALLMPKVMLIRAAERLHSTAALAEFFGTSSEIAGARMKLIDGLNFEEDGTHPAAPLHSDKPKVEKLGVSKALAAATYAQNNSAPGQSDKAEFTAERSLARIRELAKKIENWPT